MVNTCRFGGIDKEDDFSELESLMEEIGNRIQTLTSQSLRAWGMRQIHILTELGIPVTGTRSSKDDKFIQEFSARFRDRFNQYQHIFSLWLNTDEGVCEIGRFITEEKARRAVENKKSF